MKTNYQTIAMECGTGSYAAVDRDFYEWLQPRHPILERHPGRFGIYYAEAHLFAPDEIRFLHDLVMEFHGLHQGQDYEYVEFLNTWYTLSPEMNYAQREFPEPPVNQYCALDCRFDNLRPVSALSEAQNHKSNHLGVSWDTPHNRWRAYLNASEFGSQDMLGYFHTEVAAARARDLAIVLRNIDAELNYEELRSEYSKTTKIHEIQMDVTYTENFGYQPAVWPDSPLGKPHRPSSAIHFDKELAWADCLDFITRRFGPLAIGYSRVPDIKTSKGLHKICHKCGAKLPPGLNTFDVVEDRPRPICIPCWDNVSGNKDLQTDLEAVAPKEGYKRCKRCHQDKPASSLHFPTYKYKGQEKFLGTCKDCIRKSDRERKRK